MQVRMTLTDPENLYKNPYYMFGRFHRRGNLTNNSICISRITLNLFGTFLGLICLSREVRDADSESLTLLTLAQNETYLILRGWQC